MELNSSLFLRFLEKLTGLYGLVPDPYFAEASYAMSHRGGTLDIHADFSHHDHLRLERRINVLIYLNEVWEEAWNGSLNLYDDQLQLISKMFPLGNRIAIFTTSANSFHGFPEPINCPENVKRKSINMYYYTLPRMERDVKKILFPAEPTFQPLVTKE
jgi:Rps23 Pro-64 3,4-dihydroxylase Tpa1-like proline 4-hydroxylase